MLSHPALGLWEEGRFSSDLCEAKQSYKGALTGVSDKPTHQLSPGRKGRNERTMFRLVQCCRGCPISSVPLRLRFTRLHFWLGSHEWCAMEEEVV
jgi:hypothetical protein